MKKSKIKEIKALFKGKRKRILIFELFVSVIIGGIFFLFTKEPTTGIIAFVIALILAIVYTIGKMRLAEAKKISQIENVFPDFLQLVSSNLRAGMTTDRALIVSARKEFYPLDVEIMKVGRELLTGEEMEKALLTMTERINSDKITKTVRLIVSGMRTGGNLAILLEDTALNMREKNFLEQRASSNVLMYVIFIVFAISVGAPALFALSSVLVEVLTSVLATIPQVQSNVNVPFTLTKISISPNFIFYFSLIFILVTDILGSFVIGIVGKGDEKDGIKYALPIIIVSITIFLVIKGILSKYFAGIF